MDYLAALTKINFAAHGYCSNFVLAVMDREWKPGMNEDEAIAVIRKCIHELKTRFLISLPSFTVKVVDKDGCRTVKL